MPEIVQEIGAYAGLAAIVGLAVLSALYFSQARDVKRLREWAGRAPERTAEGVAAPQVAQRVVAQPQPKPATAQVAAGGAKPATAKGPPVPATAQPAAATPAAQKGQAAPATPAPAGAGGGKAAEAPGVPVPAGATAKTEQAETGEEKAAVPVAAGAAAGAELSASEGKPAETAAAGPTAQAGTAAPAKPGDGAGEAPAGPAPAGTAARGPSTPAAARGPQPSPLQGGGARPPRFPARPREPLPSETAILSPPREQASWLSRLLASPRYLVLALAGVLIIGGGAAFGLAQFAEEEAPPPRTEESRFQEEESPGKEARAPAINPADVTVSILNGTTVPGLAAQIGDKIESFGFQLGNVTNNSDQTRNESVVLYAPGAEREATTVGRRLGITQREEIDPQSQALGGDARVVVIAGADQTQ